MESRFLTLGDVGLAEANEEREREREKERKTEERNEKNALSGATSPPRRTVRDGAEEPARRRPPERSGSSLGADARTVYMQKWLKAEEGEERSGQ